MKTIAATEAKNRFGELLEGAAVEPVRIERNGRPVAYVVSAAEYEDVEELLGFARAARRIANEDQEALDVLRRFSAGEIPRRVAVSALGLRGYGQLLRCLDAAGLARPVVPEAERSKMVEEMLRAIRG